MSKLSDILDAEMRNVARSRWGEINTQLGLVPGVKRFDTHGHGGFVVDGSRFQLNRKLCRKPFLDRTIRVKITVNEGMVTDVDASFYAFEEDCDWAALFYLHPELIAAYEKQVKRRYPDFKPEPFIMSDLRETVQNYVKAVKL